MEKSANQTGGHRKIQPVLCFAHQDELREIVEDGIEECLGQGDRVIGLQWDTKSVTLAIADIESFRRRSPIRKY